MTEPQLTETVPVDAPLKPRRTRPKKQRIYPKLDKTPFNVGDPLPNMLSTRELMRALNVNENTFDDLERAGKFKQFEFRKPIQKKRRYSGVLVTRYLQEPR